MGQIASENGFGCWNKPTKNNKDNDRETHCHWSCLGAGEKNKDLRASPPFPSGWGWLRRVCVSKETKYVDGLVAIITGIPKELLLPLPSGVLGWHNYCQDLQMLLMSPQSKLGFLRMTGRLGTPRCTLHVGKNMADFHTINFIQRETGIDPGS